MADIKEMDKTIRISVGLLGFMAGSIILATFSLTTIYNQFLLRDEVIREMKTNIEYIDVTLRKISKRNADAIKEIEGRTTVLELPNSDK